MRVRIRDVVAPVFWPVHRAIARGTVQELVAKGGRGSGKSSYISIELVLQLLRHPACHAVVLRKIGGTLRTSVYAQIQWAIGALGLAKQFRCTVSPMECTYLPTGQKILFFGTDDPGKLKSIKVPFGAIGLAWFEELDQFDGPEEVRSVEQSVFRGGSFTLAFKSFNPPASGRSWANRYALEQRPGKLVHHSTYRDLPPAWLGERFLADAAHLEQTNPTAFRHEYLGEAVGCGTAVFGNIQLQTLTTEQCQSFDRVYHGVDWGWYPDPWAYNAVHYDAARRTLRLPDCQNNLIARIAAVQKNTVVVLHAGAPVECPWAGDVSAVLCMYLAGEGVGEATDALLWGDANPSGRLPETWPLRLEDTPCYLDYPGDGRTADYREGVYVGYRWYDARRMPVLWPFGHGMGYTGFVYRNARLSADTLAEGGEVKVCVTVKNSGAVRGAEVVQLYISDETGAPIAGGRVPQVLRGFSKVWLDPGEERDVEFVLTARDLAHYDPTRRAWHTAPGRYLLRLGHTSRDIRASLGLNFG